GEERDDEDVDPVRGGAERSEAGVFAGVGAGHGASVLRPRPARGNAGLMLGVERPASSVPQGKENREERCQAACSASQAAPPAAPQFATGAGAGAAGAGAGGCWAGAAVAGAAGAAAASGPACWRLAEFSRALMAPRYWLAGYVASASRMVASALSSCLVSWY